MVPIHTKPPSREYDEGWDAIFGKRPANQKDWFGECTSGCADVPNQTCDVCSQASDAPDREKQRAALRELTQLTQEFGGYDTERDTSEPGATPLDPEE